MIRRPWSAIRRARRGRETLGSLKCDHQLDFELRSLRHPLSAELRKRHPHVSKYTREMSQMTNVIRNRGRDSKFGYDYLIAKPPFREGRDGIYLVYLKKLAWSPLSISALFISVVY